MSVCTVIVIVVSVCLSVCLSHCGVISTKTDVQSGAIVEADLQRPTDMDMVYQRLV